MRCYLGHHSKWALGGGGGVIVIVAIVTSERYVSKSWSTPFDIKNEADEV
jgi:hypothetical protein